MALCALLVTALTAASPPGQGEGRGGDRLPPEIDVRYRVEIAGERVGWARLALTCSAARCSAVWESGLRAPEEAGGEVLSRRIEIEAAAGGTARRVLVEAEGDGRSRRHEGAAGAIPATFAELLLSRTGEGERRCIEVRDEESGRAGSACARRLGAWLEGEVLGEPIRFRAEPGGPPSEVVLPAQGVRFVADRAAAIPPRAPRLFGTTVRTPGPAGTLCGARRDEPPPAVPAAAPRSFPPGATCRERTARYLELAARAGLRGRHAVGIAFDGRSLVWHEWAELLLGSVWIPIDPSFEQAPAAGKRFTIARYEDGDVAARAEAGRKVLACWGAVSAAPP